MNMTISGKLIIGVLGLITAGGVLYGLPQYLESSKKSNASVEVEQEGKQDGSPQTGAVPQKNPSGKKMAFLEFLKQGGSFKCTVAMATNGYDMTGTIYTRNKDVNAVTTGTVAGQKITTNMIMKDGYTYTWTSLAPGMGYKMKTIEASVSSDTPVVKNSPASSLQDIGDYSCEVWSGTDAMFAIPSGISFTEINLPQR